MKKLFKIFLIAVVSFAFVNVNGVCSSQWELLNIDGDTDPTDYDDATQQQNDALDRLTRNYREGCMLLYSSAAELTIQGPCSAMICNSAGTDCEMRYSATDVTVSWADIDTGSESSSTVTQYYVYLTADTDVAGFVEKISTSATAPSGATAYRKIGYFTNDGDDDIVSVGNIAGGDIVNSISVTNSDQRSTTAATYVELADTTLYFVSSGRPLMIYVQVAMTGSTNINSGIKLYMDSDLDETENGMALSAGSASYYGQEMNAFYYGTPSSGTHTIYAKIARQTSGTMSVERSYIVAMEV